MTTGRWVAAGLIALVAVAAFGFGVRAGDMRDFEVYWTAATRASSGEPLYRLADQHYQFKYLPAFAVLAIPVAWMPLAVAKAGWLVLSVALIIALVAGSVAVLPQQRRPTAVLAATAIIAMGKFYGHELVLGQVNLLFAVLVTTAILSLQRDRVVTAVTLLVFAVVIKPYAVIFLPWVVLLYRGRALLPLVVAGSLVPLIPVVVYGVGATAQLHLDWWRTVADSTAPNLTNQDNVSIAAFFAKWLGSGAVASALAAGAGLLALGAVAIAVVGGRGLARREALEGALLLMVIPLLSPQGWDYVFLVATPAVLLFANYDDHLPPGMRALTWIAVATIGLSLFDVLGRQRYAVFMSWSVITLCFVVLVGALVSLRLRRVA